MQLRSLLNAAALLSASLVAHADTIYTYQSPAFTSIDAGMGLSPGAFLTITLTYANPLAANIVEAASIQNLPLSYSFSDGVHTLTNANSGTNVFTLATDSLGNITSFAFTIQNATTIMGATVNNGSGSAISGLLGPGSSPSATVSGQIGTFTPVASAATPEPSSIALLGTGLLGLAGFARKRFA